jgi:hypothetical protein
MFSMLLLRKPGNTVAKPLIMTDPTSLDGSWELTLESTAGGIDAGTAGNEGMSSTPVQLLTRGGSATDRIVLIRPSERVSCLGDGRPVLATRGGVDLLVGLVVGPGSCNEDGVLHVALVAPELTWLVQAAACTQNQQMMFTSQSSTTPGCRYQFRKN